MNDRSFIPTYRAGNMTPPDAVPMPELPTLRSPVKFSWLKSVLFPGIQLAVLGGGIYLLFTQDMTMFPDLLNSGVIDMPLPPTGSVYLCYELPQVCRGS